MLRKLSQTIGAVLLAVTLQSASAITITNFFDTDPGWTGANNTTSGNSYGYSSGTSVAGGSPGEVGGTLARSSVENYYADTNMGGLVGGYFTLNDPLIASGKFDATNLATMNNNVLIGHRSAGLVDHSGLGLGVFEFSTTHVRVGALFERPNGTLQLSALSAMPIDQNSTFSYSYDPTFNGGVGFLGRLTVTVMTNAALFNTFTLDISTADRATGARFDAWGIGGTIINSIPTTHGDVFIDDVIYTAVPEPTALAWLGLVAVMLRRRRAHKQHD